VPFRTARGMQLALPSDLLTYPLKTSEKPSF
jgi:hypothetical protein